MGVRFTNSAAVNEEIQRNLFYMQRIERTARNFEETELQEKIEASMRKHFETYNLL